MRPWTSTKSSTSLKALWTKRGSTLGSSYSGQRVRYSTAGRSFTGVSCSRSLGNVKTYSSRGRVPTYCFLFFCLGSCGSSVSCDSVGWKRHWDVSQQYKMSCEEKIEHSALSPWWIHEDRAELLICVWNCTDLLTVDLLLQRCLQSGSVNTEVSWRAQLHVLHQIYLDRWLSTPEWMLWHVDSFKKFSVQMAFFKNVGQISQGVQLTHTFDFFESVMRYFSYCSMLKIRFGMAFVSRRSFAYQVEEIRSDLLKYVILNILFGWTVCIPIHY